MQDIEPARELHRHDRAVGIFVIPDRDLKHSPTEPLERLGILRYSTKLKELQLVAD